MSDIVLEYGSFDLAAHTEGEYDAERMGNWHWSGTFQEVIGLSHFQTIVRATRNRVPVDFIYPADGGAIPLDKQGIYDIVVTRLTPDRDDIKVTDKLYYVGHTETEYDEFTYPRQALVGVRALLTDQVSGSFAFSCHTKGSLVDVYDSVAQTWTPQWSNNPAWVCYDILTSPVFYDAALNVAVSKANQRTSVARYDGADPDRIDLDSFIAYAAFCNASMMEGRGQSVVVASGGAQKYKCLQTHTALTNLQPGVDYYIDKIPPTNMATSGVGVYTTNATEVEFREGWRALDHVATTGWECVMTGSPLEAWLQFQFATAAGTPTPTRIRRYTVTWANGGEYAGDWVFEGLSGETWIALHSVAGFAGDVEQTKHTYDFTNDTAYDCYRLRITENTHNAYLIELEMFDTDESWQNYWEATATGDATTWTSGMRYYFGTEPRYTFNGGFDMRTSRWTAAMSVCSVSQSALLTVGTKIYVVIDNIKTPSQLITEGNLISFKEQFLDLSNRATEISAEFKNAEKDYASDNVVAFLSNDPTMYGRADIKTFGLTKASEVWRVAKHTVVQNQKRHVCEIEMDIDAIASMVGDVVYLQSETPDWEGSHGGVVLSATTNTITFDREVTIATGITYTVMVRIATDNTIVTKVVAATTPGNYSTLTMTTTWGATNPAFGDIYAFGEVDKTVKTFSIMNIVPTKDHGATMTVIEYNADLYTQIDNTSPEIYQEDVLAYASYVYVTELVLAEGTAVDLNGNLVRSIEATWVASIDGPAYAKGKVYLRFSAPSGGLAGEWLLQDTTEDTNYTISPVLANTTYDVMIVGVDTMGLTAPMNSPLNAIATIGIGTGGLVLITDNVTLTLALVNNKLVLSWNRLADIWVSGYAVYLALHTIADPDPVATLLTTVTQGEGMLTYTYEPALVAGTYEFTLRAVSKEGVEGVIDIAIASLEILAPATPVLHQATNGQNLTLTWQDCKTTLDIDHYTVNGISVPTPNYKETNIPWTTKSFDVVAVDVAGIASVMATIAVEIIVSTAVTAIYCIGKVYAIQVLLTYAIFVGFEAVEVWASQTNDRLTATKIAETTSVGIDHTGLDIGDTWYYWARIRTTQKTWGAWYQLGDNEGTMGQVSVNPTDYLNVLLIDESGLTDILRTRIATIDSIAFLFDQGVFGDDNFYGLTGAYNALATILVKHDTSVIDGLFRLSLAETDIIAGKAGQWASITDTVIIANQATDRIAAVENRIEVYDTKECEEWVSGGYNVGDIVAHDGTFWRCKVQHTTAHEPAEGTYWTEIVAGLLAQWTLKMTVNNHVAGVGLMLNGDTGLSDFAILADKFRIMLPNDTGDPVQVFTAGMIGNVPAVGIDGDLIVDGTILARSIAAGQLIVGVNVSMGEGAYISWANIVDPPAIIDGVAGLPGSNGADGSTGTNGVNGLDGIQTFRQNDTPVGATTGDLWYKTNDPGRRIFRYNGSTWDAIAVNTTYISDDGIYTGTLTAVQVNAVAINAGSITAGELLVDRIRANSIVTGKIALGAVTTDRIFDNAVSQSVLVNVSGGTATTGDLTWFGGSVHISVVFMVAEVMYRTFTLKRDTTTLVSSSCASSWVSMVFIDNPPAGSHTYTAEISGPVWTTQMSILEVLK